MPERLTERLRALQPSSAHALAQSTTQQSGDVPNAPNAQQPALYELDRYVKLRDPLMLVGCGLVLYGVSLYSVPAMFILAGVFLLVISWMMAR